MHGDVPHRHANIGVDFAGNVDLARGGQRLGRHPQRNGSIHGSSSGSPENAAIGGKVDRTDSCASKSPARRATYELSYASINWIRFEGSPCRAYHALSRWPLSPPSGAPLVNKSTGAET